MINKGTSCKDAFRLAKHVTRRDTNERVEVKEIRGTVAQDVLGALREMETVACGARTAKPFYHGSINTRGDERLTDEQRLYAVDQLETALGLTGQPRVVVVHEKKDRVHTHIVWSRIDVERMAAISDSFNYRKHELVARQLEREFGHVRVQGAHVERDGKERPERTPSHREMLQAERTGVSAAAAKAKMTELWQGTGNGQSFRNELEKTSWLLARGDRRDFVVIDINGGIHSLARRIEGAKAADIRERFADLDPKSLPSVADAKRMQSEREGQRTQEAGIFRGEAEAAIVRPAAAKAKMTELWNATGNGEEFRAQLEKTWWLLARDEHGKFVAIDAAGSTHGVAHRIPGATENDVRKRFADLDPKSLPSVAEAQNIQQKRWDERAQQAAARAIAKAQPEASDARASVQPRTRGRAGRSAGHVAAQVAESVFSALMGEKPVPKPKESDASKQAKSAATPSERRQELMRQLSREIPVETERDAEYERERNEKDRGRERTRGS